MARRSGTNLGLVLLGLLAWAVAVAFAVLYPSNITNVAATGAAGRFAIAVSLCMLGAA
jgi:hypothetical protein